MKSGDTEWVEWYLYDKWQRITRHPEFIAFIDAHGDEFDEHWMLKTEAALSSEAEEIKARFGLSSVFHPRANMGREDMLELPLFQDPLAVSYEWREKGPGLYTPVWEDHFIKLRIDISPVRPLGQILSEVREFVEGASEFIEIADGETEERRHLKKRIEYYEIWDERKKKTPFSVIASEMGISKDSAVKRFLKAYELINGRPYDRDAFKSNPVLQSELRKTCENCQDKECLEGLKNLGDWTPCPEVAHYVEQDYAGRQEPLSMTTAHMDLIHFGSTKSD